MREIHFSDNERTGVCRRVKRGIEKKLTTESEKKQQLFHCQLNKKLSPDQRRIKSHTFSNQFEPSAVLRDLGV
jgi:hypothetical protein